MNRSLYAEAARPREGTSSGRRRPGRLEVIILVLFALCLISTQAFAMEKKNLWHASLASALAVAEGLQVVGNVGIESNTDRNATVHPAFILCGIVYSASENLDLDFGLKSGLDKAETDYSVLAGITWRI